MDSMKKTLHKTQEKRTVFSLLDTMELRPAYGHTGIVGITGLQIMEESEEAPS